ncbi:MAG: hypothetical protein AAFR07_14745 [Pseudomonadota bacterium]
MLQHSDPGMTVNSAPTRGEALDPRQKTIAVFLGRARSGPLQRPVPITSFADFERHFGEPWEQSTLSMSVRQFFQHGGRSAIVVRVAANARGGTLELPTALNAWKLTARNPGSTERLRASVDVDGVSSDTRFNLTVQRLDARSGQIVDQEFFSDISCSEGDSRFAVHALEQSRLLAPPRSPPEARPKPSAVDFITNAIGYVDMSDLGSDGDHLTDYDLVGSERHTTGLFSLDDVERFDFLYACGAPGRPAAGAAFIVAAERYCATRNAIFVVDPPDDCRDAASLLGWRRLRPVSSPHCMTYFPPVIDRESTDASSEPAAGALMGLLCRQDDRHHVYHALSDDIRQNSAALHRDWQPAYELQPDDALALLRGGVNPLIPGMQGRLLFPGLVTSANTLDRAQGSLPQQRLTKFILGQIDRGTRWAVFSEPDEQVWSALRTQIAEFLRALAEQGAFVGSAVSDGWWVQCDAATNANLSDTEHTVRVLVGFQPKGALQPVMYSLLLQPNGTRATRTALHQASATL